MLRALGRLIWLGAYAILGAFIGTLTLSMNSGRLAATPTGAFLFGVEVLLPPIVGALIGAFFWNYQRCYSRKEGKKNPAQFFLKDMCFLMFVLAVVLSTLRCATQANPLFGY